MWMDGDVESGVNCIYYELESDKITVNEPIHVCIEGL